VHALSYILPTEVDAYGVAGIPSATLVRSSVMIDSLLQRREGLVWSPDAGGWPCYMARSRPTQTLTVAGPVNPGRTISIPMPLGFQASDNLIGEVVILDRANSNIVEACAVRSYTPTTMILDAALYTHPGPVTMDFGLTIFEERSLPAARSISRVAEWPLVRIVSGAGRYGYGRRSEQALGSYQDINLLTVFGAFGGPPAWEYFSIDGTSFNSNTSEIWVPPGILLAYYTDVKIRYIAGWPIGGIPEEIKQATAMLANAIQAGQFPGNALKLKAGDHEITRGVATVLDVDMMRVLVPYKAHLLV